MSVKVTLEFKSVDEAIVALGKLVGAAAAEQRTDKAQESSTSAAPATRTRKPRADKGQPREPYGPRTTEAGASAGANQATATAGNSTPGTTDAGKAAEQAVTPTSTTPAAPGCASPSAAPSTTAPAAPAPTDAVIQAAVERLFNAKDYETTAAVLSKFGVKRGKDLPAELRAEFVRRVDDILAGKYDALASWPA